MWVEVNISQWPFDSALCTIHVKILKDVGTVIREADASRKAPSVIGRTDVPSIRRLAQQGGTIRARTRRIHVMSPRCCVAIVSQDAESTEETWQVSEVLLKA